MNERFTKFLKLRKSYLGCSDRRRKIKVPVGKYHILLMHFLWAFGGSFKIVIVG